MISKIWPDYLEMKNCHLLRQEGADFVSKQLSNGDVTSEKHIKNAWRDFVKEAAC